MKNSEIRELATGDIVDKIKAEKDAFLRLKINHTVSEIDRPQKFGEMKKFIARLKTELRRRELENL